MCVAQLIIFTDAETEFKKNFAKIILQRFQDKKIGVVVGNLQYREDTSASNQGESLYWMYEKKLRSLEEECGILSSGTGAAMAIRKKLFTELALDEDIDSAVPIDALFQGFRVVYEWDAIAFDSTIASEEQAFNSKVRGASQTIICWLNRLNLRLILEYKNIFLSFLQKGVSRNLDLREKNKRQKCFFRKITF